MKKPFVITVVGPTSSGKSDLAVWIAQNFNGEVVSVDSRQIYKGMDIGTGKVPLELDHDNKQIKTYKNIPHWGLDIASPKRLYSVTNFQKYADKIIKSILKRGKLPILCGGSSFWMDSVVYGYEFPKLPPNHKLRKDLAKKSTTELLNILENKDPKRASQIDRHNPRRLIRAIEIAMSCPGEIKPLKPQLRPECIWVGLCPEKEELRKKISERLEKRVKQGMIKEVEFLKNSGVSFKKLENFGLEYKYASLFLQNKIDAAAFKNELLKSIFQYTKRQMTWWKRNPEINWFSNATDAKIFIKKTLHENNA